MVSQNRILSRLPLVFIPAMLPATAFAEAINDPKVHWNELWRDLMIDITSIGVLFALITLYLLFRFRRRRPDEVGSGKPLTPLAAFGWVLIPVFVFMADDIFLAAKNFELWNSYRNPPSNSLVIKAEGYMWSWDFTYPEGIQTTNELRVPVGQPVKIRLTSRDVIHSFFIPDYRVKWDAVKGRENYLWFYPDKVGEHVLTCTEFCGMLHSNMYGKVIVMPADAYNKWIEENKPKSEVGKAKPEEEKSKGGAI